MGSQALWDGVVSDALADAATWLGNYQSVLVLFVAVAVVGMVVSMIANARK